MDAHMAGANLRTGPGGRPLLAAPHEVTSRTPPSSTHSNTSTTHVGGIFQRGNPKNSNSDHDNGTSRMTLHRNEKNHPQKETSYENTFKRPQQTTNYGKMEEIHHHQFRAPGAPFWMYRSTVKALYENYDFGTLHTVNINRNKQAQMNKNHDHMYKLGTHTLKAGQKDDEILRALTYMYENNWETIKVEEFLFKNTNICRAHSAGICIFPLECAYSHERRHHAIVKTYSDERAKSGHSDRVSSHVQVFDKYRQIVCLLIQEVTGKHFTEYSDMLAKLFRNINQARKDKLRIGCSLIRQYVLSQLHLDDELEKSYFKLALKDMFCTPPEKKSQINDLLDAKKADQARAKIREAEQIVRKYEIANAIAEATPAPWQYRKWKLTTDPSWTPLRAFLLTQMNVSFQLWEDGIITEEWTDANVSGTNFDDSILYNLPRQGCYTDTVKQAFEQYKVEPQFLIWLVTIRTMNSNLTRAHLQENLNYLKEFKTMLDFSIDENAETRGRQTLKLVHYAKRAAQKWAQPNPAAIMVGQTLVFPPYRSLFLEDEIWTDRCTGEEIIKKIEVATTLAERLEKADKTTRLKFLQMPIRYMVKNPMTYITDLETIPHLALSIFEDTSYATEDQRKEVQEQLQGMTNDFEFYAKIWEDLKSTMITEYRNNQRALQDEASSATHHSDSRYCSEDESRDDESEADSVLERPKREKMYWHKLKSYISGKAKGKKTLKQKEVQIVLPPQEFHKRIEAMTMETSTTLKESQEEAKCAPQKTGLQNPSLKSQGVDVINNQLNQSNMTALIKKIYAAMEDNHSDYDGNREITQEMQFKDLPKFSNASIENQMKKDKLGKVLKEMENYPQQAHIANTKAKIKELVENRKKHRELFQRIDDALLETTKQEATLIKSLKTLQYCEPTLADRIVAMTNGIHNLIKTHQTMEDTQRKTLEGIKMQAVWRVLSVENEEFYENRNERLEQIKEMAMDLQNLAVSTQPDPDELQTLMNQMMKDDQEAIPHEVIAFNTPTGQQQSMIVTQEPGTQEELKESHLKIKEAEEDYPQEDYEYGLEQDDEAYREGHAPDSDYEGGETETFPRHNTLAQGTVGCEGHLCCEGHSMPVPTHDKDSEHVIDRDNNKMWSINMPKSIDGPALTSSDLHRILNLVGPKILQATGTSRCPVTRERPDPP